MIHETVFTATWIVVDTIAMCIEVFISEMTYSWYSNWFLRHFAQHVDSKTEQNNALAASLFVAMAPIESIQLFHDKQFLWWYDIQRLNTSNMVG